MHRDIEIWRECRLRSMQGLRCIAISVAVSGLLGRVDAQVSPEEHASHHPEEQQGSSSKPEGPKPQGSENAPGERAGGMMGGMGGMGEMMRKMGVPPPKELYPSLMELPDLPLEKRAELRAQAHQRMKDGAARLSTAFDELGRAAPSDDFAAMQLAVDRIREGTADFQSGLSTHRALAEGKAPRNVAMEWFKSQMNLGATVASTPQAKGPFGWGWLHFSVMLSLVVFTASMLWMYFHKMRRATELLADLAIGQPASSHERVLPAPPPEIEDTSAAVVPAVRETTTSSSKSRPTKWSGKLRVCQTFQETATIKTFRLVSEDGSGRPFDYLPGQFLMLSVPYEASVAKRAYTMSSSPTVGAYIEITVKREDKGVVSKYLHDSVRVGDVLEASAPMGKFTFTGGDDGIVLIGGGVGVTPLMSVVRYLTDIAWGGEITLLFACRTTGDFVFREELEFLQRRHANLAVVATMTRDDGTVWMGSRGRMTPESIASAAPNLKTQRVHICGPSPMMEAVKEMLVKLEVPTQNVKTEAFGPAPKKGEKAARKAPKKRKTSSAKQKEVDPVVPIVTFAQSKKSAALPADQTVLDVAEQNDIDIDASCRSGTCGSCKVRLLEGEVCMEFDDGLEPGERDAGWILACQSKSKDDVAVDV